MEGIPDAGNPHRAIFYSISASKSAKDIYSARFSASSLAISWASQGLDFRLSKGNMDTFLLPLGQHIGLIIAITLRRELEHNSQSLTDRSEKWLLKTKSRADVTLSLEADEIDGDN